MPFFICVVLIILKNSISEGLDMFYLCHFLEALERILVPFKLEYVSYFITNTHI